MIRTLRRLVHILGMQLIDRGRFRVVPRSRFAETLAELLGQPGFFFIQVGAHDGVRFDDLYRKVTAVHAGGIVLEPLPRYFERLRINYEDHPGVVPLKLAIHPVEKRIPLHHVKPEAIAAAGLAPWAAGIGSVLPTHHQRSGIPAAAMTTTVVDCLSFEELLEREGVTRIDLLQIDAEGFDAELIRMFPFERVKPRLIKFEQINLDEAARRDVWRLLEHHGYEVWVEGEDAVAAPPGRRPRR